MIRRHPGDARDVLGAIAAGSYFLIGWYWLEWLRTNGVILLAEWVLR